MSPTSTAVLLNNVEGLVTAAVKAAEEETRSAPEASVLWLELQDERRRREKLERRVDYLSSQLEKSVRKIDEVEIASEVSAALREAGVHNPGQLQLYRTIVPDVTRDWTGALVVRGVDEDIPLRRYITTWLSELMESLHGKPNEVGQYPHPLTVKIQGGDAFTGTTTVVGVAQDSADVNTA